jgi:predicted HAD superfamily Cof-like phosphohydrolase
MTPEQAMVAEFHRAAGMSPPSSLTKRDEDMRALRARLVLEEAREVEEALSIATATEGETQIEQLAALAKELSDQLYVVYGTAVEMGIDLDPVFGAVHRSNMAKFEGGMRLREDGKVLKPDGWQSPEREIRKILRSQLAAR